MTRKRTDWRSPLNIPEGRAGDYAITHDIVPAGEPVPLCTMRNRLFGQTGPAEVVFNEPTRWHRLTGPTGTWMTDLPVEQRQHDELLKGMRGHVLVGGLGLGYAATVLARRKTVTRVTVVEISPEVIELVAKHTARDGGWGKIHVAHQDLHEYLHNTTGRKFDHAFYDIWQSDGEGTFHETVVPLLKASVGKVKRRPVCWNEGIMRGQLIMSLTTRLAFLPQAETSEIVKQCLNGHPPWEPLPEGPGAIYHNWAVPFWQWWREEKPAAEAAQYAARAYATVYGDPLMEPFWLDLAREGMPA